MLCVCVDAHRGQKRALDHLELELQVSCPRWAQGIKLGCCERMASILN